MITTDLAKTWKQYRFNPASNVSPEKVATALNRFDAGFLREAALMWETIEERDDVLQIVAPKRRNRVASRPYEILAVDDSDEAAAHQQTLKDFFNTITVTDATDENLRGGFRHLVQQMMTSVFCKYAVHELVFDTSSGSLRGSFRFVPLYFFENTIGRLRYTGAAGAIGQDLGDPEGWMITVSSGCIMKAAMVCYIFKRLSLHDWLNFSEKFGIPGVHGETTAARGTKEFQDFVNALAQFANEWVTVTNQGAKINLVETKTTGEAPFQPMVERMDRRMASLCVGGDLSTISRENAIGANPQSADAEDMTEDDCQLISETLQTQVARQVIRYVHGVEPLAYIKLIPPQSQDIKSDVLVDTLLTSLGGELPAAETYERYNRTVPDSMEKGATLKKAAPMPAPVSMPSTESTPSTPSTDATVAENDDLLQNALASALGVVPQWLAPVSDLIQQLEAKAKSGISDAELIDFIQKATNRLPELFADLNISALADDLDAAMGTAVINGVTTAMRKTAKK